MIQPQKASYTLLRRIVGLLSIMLPIVLGVWGSFIHHAIMVQPSISSYYAIEARDALVGILFAVGWFLISYKGYETNDAIAGTIAGVSAMGVALFPWNGTALQQIVHPISATILFLTLIYMSVFLFTKSSGMLTAQKIKRNKVYIWCGIIMFVSLILAVIYEWRGEQLPVFGIMPVFWLETFMLWAFGFSWLVKGDTLWSDTP